MAKQRLLLPDSFKKDVAVFLACAAGQALLAVIKSRGPDYPVGTESAHEYHRLNGKIEGFNECLDILNGLPQELQPDDTPLKLDPALNPVD